MATRKRRCGIMPQRLFRVVLPLEKTRAMNS
jgi:hypothetical protein